MTYYESIKNMSISEMAKFLSEAHDFAVDGLKRQLAEHGFLIELTKNTDKRISILMECLNSEVAS